MRKIILLLVCALYAGMAAHARKYDKEFTIQINGTEEWTPFPGKTSVEFTIVDEEYLSEDRAKDIISFSDDKKTIRFTGKKNGDAIITAVAGNLESSALVQVRSTEAVINYKYNPPKDNYCIMAESRRPDGKVEKQMSAYTGGRWIYSRDVAEDGYRLADFPNDMAYTSWSLGGWEVDAHQGLIEEPGDVHPFPLDAMHRIAIQYISQERHLHKMLEESYVGNEVLHPKPYETVGIRCWVFEVKWQGMEAMKYWIDPKNGCCLRYEDIGKTSKSRGKITVVTEYNLNYTSTK